MNISTEVLFIFIYLGGRLLFYDINSIIGSARRKGFLRRILWGLLFLFLINNFFSSLVLLLLYLLAIVFDTFAVNHRKRDKSVFYIFHMIAGVILIPALSGTVDADLFTIFNPFHYAALYILQNFIVLDSLVHNKAEYFTAVLSGFIFTIKEGTIIIRLGLAKMSTVPKKKDEPGQRDNKEYDRGKLIGILERALIYFLIIVNQVAAIAIIIALKSLARFKELEDKNFAEYFLIGSLLSICIALFPAFLIKWLF